MTDRHDLTEYWVDKGLAENHQKEHHRHGDGDRDAPGGAGLGFQEPQHAMATIFGGASVSPSRRRAKLLWREFALPPCVGELPAPKMVGYTDYL
jgi:hypothetical protein